MKGLVFNCLPKSECAKFTEWSAKMEGLHTTWHDHSTKFVVKRDLITELGLKYCGSGAFSSAYKYGPNMVMKTNMFGSYGSDAQYIWLEYAAKNQHRNPLFPVIYFLWIGEDNRFVVVMERLNSVEDEGSYSFAWRKTFRNYIDGIVKDAPTKGQPLICSKLLKKFESQPVFVPEIEKQIRKEAIRRKVHSTYKAAQELLALKKSTPVEISFDLHSGNFMYRDNGTMVITDPMVAG